MGDVPTPSQWGLQAYPEREGSLHAGGKRKAAPELDTKGITLLRQRRGLPSETENGKEPPVFEEHLISLSYSLRTFPAFLCRRGCAGERHVSNRSLCSVGSLRSRHRG